MVVHRWLVVSVLVVAAGCRLGFDPALRGLDGNLGSNGDDAMPGDDAPPTTDSALPTSDAAMVTTDAGLPPDAAPGTILPATLADTYLKGTGTTANGGAADLRVGRDVGGSNDFALLWFDLSGLPATSVTHATLRLYQYSSSGSSAVALEVRRVTETWAEAAATWAKATAAANWTTAGGTYAPTIYATATVTPGAYGAYDLDVTSLVNEWVTGTSANYGLEIVYSNSPGVSTYPGFASRENATAAYRPQLLITP